MTIKKYFYVFLLKIANVDGGIARLDVIKLFNSGKYEPVEFEGYWYFINKKCIEFLEKIDIFVMSLPFSLSYEYVNLLIDYKKHFIIGNVNSITYKYFFL